MLAFGDQLGDGGQRAAVRRIGELGDDRPRLLNEGTGALAGAGDAIVVVDDAQDARERDIVIAAVGEYGLDELPLFRRGLTI